MKTTLFVIPLTIFIVQAIISLPAITKWLGIENSLLGQVAVSVFLIMLFLANQLRLYGRDYQRFSRLKATRHSVLDRFVSDFIALYREKDVLLRINVMLPKRQILSFLEPRDGKPGRRRVRFFVQELSCEWVSETMRTVPDRSIRFTVNQGACGYAFTEREIVVQNMQESNRGFNLNGNQLKQTSHLKFLLSVPIRSLDPETLTIGDEVIGVLNIDSSSPNACAVLGEGNHSFDEIMDKGEALSEFCSQLY